MPVFHIVCTGPTASGKSRIVRHLAENLPEGFKLKSLNAMPLNVANQEYWCLNVEKLRKKNAPV